MSRDADGAFETPQPSVAPGATSPYEGRPARAFWRSGVSEQDLPSIDEIHVPRFGLDRSLNIATAGSCFAQHIAKRLREAGFKVIDREPGPRVLDDDEAKRFGYRLYSARYGNVYTTRQLLQLAREALGRSTPGAAIWTRDGRFFDALRPSVEPSGLTSETEVRKHRAHHLAHVRTMLESADVFVFTLGLTETWEHIASGTVYPTAPGVIAGRFDPAAFRFRNLTHAECLDDLISFRKLLKVLNPKARMLLTVSPVPLTATASQHHVLPATVYSKSVLRAVAGEMTGRFPDVDYFPSYEIVAAHPSQGQLFEPNLRSVSSEGVDLVMGAFFRAYGIEEEARAAAPARKRKPRKAGGGKRAEDLVCEEILLEAFSK